MKRRTHAKGPGECGDSEGGRHDIADRRNELAGNLSMVLRERMLRLQQQQLAALKVDRVYDDRLSDAISDELWTEKSAELQEQLRRVRAEMERQ